MMSLYNVFRERMYQAIKTRDPLKRDVYKYIMGEIELIQSRNGVAISDDRIIGIAKKIVEGNNITIDALKKEKQDHYLVIANLQNEIEILKEFIPSSLSEEEIDTHIDEIYHQIVQAPNDGASVGVAMKFLKGKNLQADGNIVKQVVLRLRKAEKC